MAQIYDNTTDLQTVLETVNSLPDAISVDSALSETSTNPVQNKIITSEISNLKTLVGEETVENQISTAISKITPTSIEAAPSYTYGTSDLTAGTSMLETGKLYFVYEIDSVSGGGAN